MSSTGYSYALCSLIVTMFFFNSSEAVKCFECNSANNSACLDLHMQKMHTIVPIVDCGRSIPNSISKTFFCRKITQTILDPVKSPEVRITRGCGWVKSKRECYTNDNKDHLETVCQCFGDMCNGAGANVGANLLLGAGVLALLARCRGYA